MHGSAPVKVKVCWPRPSWPLRVLIVCVAVVAFVLNSTTLALIAAALLVGNAVRGMRVSMHGGGFRPYRYGDMLDYAALSEIEAWEAEEAAARARAR